MRSRDTRSVPGLRETPPWSLATSMTGHAVMSSHFHNRQPRPPKAHFWHATARSGHLTSLRRPTAPTRRTRKNPREEPLSRRPIRPNYNDAAALGDRDGPWDHVDPLGGDRVLRRRPYSVSPLISASASCSRAARSWASANFRRTRAVRGQSFRAFCDHVR